LFNGNQELYNAFRNDVSAATMIANLTLISVPSAQTQMLERVEITISNSKVRHLRSHHFESVRQQAQRLSDAQLQAKLDRPTTFFPKHWTMDDITQNVQRAFNSLTSQGIIDGSHNIFVNGHTITVYLENGQLISAWDNIILTISDFR